MSVDIAAEVVAALRSHDGRAALSDAMRTLVAVEVRAALDERVNVQLLNSSALAEYLGITPAALRMRLRRGSELANLTLVVDGRRVWRRTDLGGISGAREEAGSFTVMTSTVERCPPPPTVTTMQAGFEQER